MRGSRQLNHALHMAAVTQVRHRHSEGRAYYDQKVAEGKTGKEALRALKRRISDALFAAMVADARRDRQAEVRRRWPGRANGERLSSLRGRLSPRETGSSAKPLPGQAQG